MPVVGVLLHEVASGDQWSRWYRFARSDARCVLAMLAVVSVYSAPPLSTLVDKANIQTTGSSAAALFSRPRMLLIRHQQHIAGGM
jgi:hypothetical protein